MNQKGYYVNIILVIVILILAGTIGYFAFVKKSEPIAQKPTPSELTKEVALQLLRNELENELGFSKGECQAEGVVPVYRSCVVDISKIGKNNWIVMVTYDRLFDDSTKAERIKTIVMYKDGQWIKGETFWTQQCWPGRGHQDFSTEPCL